MNRRHFLGSSVSAAIAAAVPGSAYANSLLQALMTVSSSVVGRSGDGEEVTIEEAALEELNGAPVSYTHLTLPTTLNSC